MPLLRDFAACAGRYSATLERQWLLGLPGSDEIAKRRASFADLVDALLPIARTEGYGGRDILNWRIEAKFAQARLLQLGDFGTNHDNRAPAHEMAARYLTQCDQMLLSG